MSLSDLPIELMLYVAKVLDPQDLNALIRTSRSFVPLVRPLLLEAALDRSTSYRNSQTAMFYAAANQDDRMIELLLRKAGPWSGSWMLLRELDGRYEYDDHESLEMEVRAIAYEGVDLTLGDMSAIQWAAFYNDERMFKTFLYEKGATFPMGDFKATGDLFRTAICTENPEILGTVLDEFRSTGRNLESELASCFIIPYALGKLKWETADLLLRAGADVNSEDLVLKRPLQYALESGDLERARKLREAGANDELPDRSDYNSGSEPGYKIYPPPPNSYWSCYHSVPSIWRSTDPFPPPLKYPYH